MSVFDAFPVQMRKSLAAGLYFNEVRLKHDLLKFLFDVSVKSREPYLEASKAVKERQNGKDLEELVELYHDETYLSLFEERSVQRTQYEDTASALILLSAVSLERLHKATGDSRFTRGEQVYNGAYFSKAVCTLANQYKHLGEWIHQPHVKQDDDKQFIVALVGDAVRTDACAEFLTKCRFADYDEYESFVFDCGSGFDTEEVVTDTTSGMVKVTLKDPHGRFREPEGDLDKV